MPLADAEIEYNLSYTMCGIHLTNMCNFEEPHFQKIRNETRYTCHRYGAKRPLWCTCVHWKNTKHTYGPKLSKLKMRQQHGAKKGGGRESLVHYCFPANIQKSFDRHRFH